MYKLSLFKGKNIDEFKTITHMYLKEIAKKEITIFLGYFKTSNKNFIMHKVQLASIEHFW
jgi:hypothetical protein